MNLPVQDGKALIGDVFRHFKGGRYFVIAVAETHEANGDIDVVYVALANGKVFTRPFKRDSRNQASWCDGVMWPSGDSANRFMSESRWSDFIAAQGFK